MGHGNNDLQNEPTQVRNSHIGSNVVDVAIGGRTSALVTNDGRVFTFASSETGSLGNGATTGSSWWYSPGHIDVPDLPPGERVVSLTGNGRHWADGVSFGVMTSDRRLHTWGRSAPVLGPAGATGDVLRPTAFQHSEIVRFGNARAASVAVADDETWTAVAPAHMPALVDVSVARGPWGVVYEQGFRFGEALSPVVQEHPRRVVAPAIGDTVALTSVVRANGEPTIQWQWAPRDSDEWQPVVDGVRPPVAEADGEVVRIVTTLDAVATPETRQYRVVYVNELGAAVTDPGTVSVALQRPGHLIVTPRTALVDALPDRV